MNSDKAKKTGPDVGSDYVRMYYEHQYERFSTLEQHGFTLSNIVIGVCLLALSWTANLDNTGNPINRTVLLYLVAAINIVAIVYLIRVFFAKRSHQKRAKAVLRQYALGLLLVDETFPQPAPLSPFKRSFIQMAFHALIILASAALIPS